MKSRVTAVLLSLLVVVSAAPTLANAAERPAKSGVQSAKLADLKKQHAANETAIKQLRAKAKADSDADRKAAQAEKDKAKQTRDSIPEMSEADTLVLQQLMEKKAQLEQMISDAMKASSE